MGFWHTGYVEFHEPTGLEDYVYSVPPPVRYLCEHCAEDFEELDGLRRHRFECHPLRQPALLIRGRVVGSLPLKLLTSLRPGEVEVEDATLCVINGREVEPARLGDVLVPMTREFVELELTNGGATTRCVLDFRIANESHLVGVEAAFLRLARDRVLTIDAVARFIHDCRCFDSAMPYCDGICHYLYGVMAKENSPDSGLRQSQYTDRYMRASDELTGFDRPLARSIRALIAFHFNQFNEAVLLAPEGALRNAAGTFSRLLQGLPWHFEASLTLAPSSAIEDLLTDQDTLQVLADVRHSLVELKSRADDQVAHLRRSSPGGYDRMKRGLLAVEALAAREDDISHKAARRLVREMATQQATIIWSEAMLDRLKTL